MEIKPQNNNKYKQIQKISRLQVMFASPELFKETEKQSEFTKVDSVDGESTPAANKDNIEEFQGLKEGDLKGVEKTDLKAEVKKISQKRKYICFAIVITILLAGSTGLALGLLLKPNDNRIVVNVPAESNYIVTDWKRCANFTVQGENGAQTEYKCTTKVVESRKVNLPGQKNTSSIYELRKKENDGEFRDQSNITNNNPSRILSFLSRRLLGGSQEGLVCQIEDPKCKETLNSIPVMYIEYDDETNKIKNVSFPILLNDEQKLELLDQGSQYHPELNTSLINRPEDKEKKTVESKRGDETFSGTLTENKKGSAFSEYEYNLQNSSNSSQSPVTSQQKTVIDTENKRIVESQTKTQRTLTQNGNQDVNNNGNGRLLEEKQGSMSLTSSTEINSKVVSTEKNYDLAELLEKIKSLQDLETYTLEEVNQIAERYNKKQNNITDPKLVAPSDGVSMGEQDNATSTGSKRMLLGANLYGAKIGFFSANIFGVPLTAESTVLIYEGDIDTADFVQQTVDIYVNGNLWFRPVLFQGYLPITLKPTFTNINALSTLNSALSASKSLTATIIQFCFSINSVSLCGKVDLVMKYGINYKTQHYPNSRFEGSIVPYFNANISGTATADLTVMKAGIQVTGTLVSASIPVTTTLQYAPRKSTMNIKVTYGAFNFSILGWFQITQAKCNISSVCLSLWNASFCVTNPCNVVDKTKTYSFLASGSSGVAKDVQVVTKALQ